MLLIKYSYLSVIVAIPPIHRLQSRGREYMPEVKPWKVAHTSNPAIPYSDTEQSDVPRRCMCDCLRLHVLFLFSHHISIGMFLRVHTTKPTSGSSRKYPPVDYIVMCV